MSKKKKVDVEYWPVVEGLSVPIRQNHMIDGRSTLSMGIHGGAGDHKGVKFTFSYGMGGTLEIHIDEKYPSGDGPYPTYCIRIHDAIGQVIDHHISNRDALSRP